MASLPVLRILLPPPRSFLGGSAASSLMLGLLWAPAVWTSSLAVFHCFDDLDHFRFGWWVGVYVKLFSCWWYVGNSWWRWLIEYFLEMLRPLWSLFRLICDGFPIFILQWLAWVGVLSYNLFMLFCLARVSASSAISWMKYCTLRSFFLLWVLTLVDLFFQPFLLFYGGPCLYC